MCKVYSRLLGAYGFSSNQNSLWSPTKSKRMSHLLTGDAVNLCKDAQYQESVLYCNTEMLMP